MGALFFTGFPGFIGKRLIKALVKEFDYERVYLLVEPRMLERARREIENFDSRFEIIPGDITQENLGIKKDIKSDITHLFHLAAIYDLTVPFDPAYRVNVEGTKNVVEFAKKLSGLEKFVYFSTAYVSGTRRGTVYEDELDKKQSFKNHYEHTKFLAELIVQKNKDQIPTVVVRPGIVIGDSQTGETDKFDGPYYVMIFFKKVPRFIPLPYLGKGEAEVNLVPVDFIIKATVALTGLEKSVGKTYHLTDPSPFTARELYRLFSIKIRGKEPVGEIPLPIVQAFLKIKPLARAFGVPYEATPYFIHKVHYDSTNTQQDLGPLGITVPPLTSYVDNIVKFFLENYKNPALRTF